MQSNVTYLFLDILFLGIPLVWIILNHKILIRRYRKLVIYAVLFGTVGYAVAEQLGTFWHAWGYDRGKTLGIQIGSSVLETYVFAVLVSVIIALVTAICAEAEEKKKPFKTTFRN